MISTPAAVRQSETRDAGRMAAAMALRGVLPHPDGAKTLSDALTAVQERMKVSRDDRILSVWWSGYRTELLTEANRRARIKKTAFRPVSSMTGGGGVSGF